MVRLTLVLALLWSGAAGAGCLTGVPQSLALDDGSRVTILSHTAKDVSYRTKTADGETTTVTMREALFPTVQGAQGLVIRFDWLADLPKLRDLAPGDKGRVDADMVVENAQRSGFRVGYDVLRRDEVVLGACRYPVLVVRKSIAVNGRTQAVMTLWLSQDLRVPLRTEVAETGKPAQVYRVASLQ